MDGGRSTGADLFQSGYQLLSTIKDRVSGVYDVQRGSMPYATSGIGIQSLQSATDLLTTMPRRHLESGLKRATILRMKNILQFMRGSRVIEIIDQKDKKERTLFVGNSMAEIAAEYGLQPSVDQATGVPMVDPATGEPLMLVNPNTQEEADVMVLNEDTAPQFDMRRCTFGTGHRTRSLTSGTDGICADDVAGHWPIGCYMGIRTNGCA